MGVFRVTVTVEEKGIGKPSSNLEHNISISGYALPMRTLTLLSVDEILQPRYE